MEVRVLAKGRLWIEVVRAGLDGIYACLEARADGAIGRSRPQRQQ
jgi:hypothetical protein